MPAHHAVYLFLYVRDLETTRRFYEDTLGLPVLELEERAVKYDAGEIILALNIAEEYSIPPPGEKDLTQLVVFHVEDLEDKRRALEDKGVSFVGPTDRYEIGATATFFDPDGHCLLLYEPSEESLTWPSGDKIREILAARSRDRTILRDLSRHRRESPAASQGAPVLKDDKILYIFNYITDVQRSREFYRDRLGFEVLEEDQGVGVVKYDAGGIVLSTHLVETQSNASRTEHMKVARSSALVLYTPDLRSTYRRYEEAGVTFDTGISEGEIGLIAGFHDPDGHRFYLYQPSAAAMSWPSGTKIGCLTGTIEGRSVATQGAS